MITLSYRDDVGWYAVSPTGKVLYGDDGIDGTLEAAAYIAADEAVRTDSDIDLPPATPQWIRRAVANILRTSQEIERGSWQGVDYR